MAERMKNGDTRSGPRSSSVRFSRSITSNPPMPLPIETPMRVAFSGVTARPLSSIAMAVAASANWMKRAHFLTSFFSIQLSGSKPFTSPAKRVVCRDASNSVIGAMPDCPAQIPFHVSAVPMPTGDTRPIPVTTTRLLMTCNYTSPAPSDEKAGRSGKAYGSDGMPHGVELSLGMRVGGDFA